MKKVALTLMIAALAALVAIPALAQNTGSVKGKVVSEKGEPLAKAAVELLDPATKKKYKGETDKSGEFQIKDVPVGTYKITMSHDGQARWAAEGFEIRAGQESPALIDLAAAKRMAELSEEEKKKILEQAKKAEAERAKIKGLNAMLAQARQMQQDGNVDGAIGIYEQAVAIDATKDLLWANVGAAYLDKAATDAANAAQWSAKAVDALKKAVAIKPTDAAYHNNLGQAYARAGMGQEALQEYAAAAQADPASAGRYYYNAGALLTNQAMKVTDTDERNKTLDQSNEMYRKAVAADPNYSDAYYQMGINLLSKAATDKQGKMVYPTGTAEAFNKYLELEPEGKYAQTSKDILGQMGAEVTTSFKRGKKK